VFRAIAMPCPFDAPHSVDYRVQGGFRYVILDFVEAMSDSGTNSSEPSTLRKFFPGYFLPDSEALASYMQSGLVALDTNALLDLYRFTPDARSEFINALELLGDRLWVPHRVAEEFLRGRLGVIKEYATATDLFIDELRETLNQATDKLQSFGSRRGLPATRLNELKESLEQRYETVIRDVSTLCRSSLSVDDAIRGDSILSRLETVLHGKVGSPLSDEESARKEAKRRMDRYIPPGYEDAKKDSEKAAGDYLMWAQLLEEARCRQLPVILVSNEQKKDWVRQEGGRKLGPRPELVEEMVHSASVSFYMINVQSFLRHVRTFLGADVSETTVEQAAQLDNEDADEEFGISLTNRDRDVLVSLCRPLESEPFATPSTAREIASDLGVTENAVSHYLLRLYEKFRIPQYSRSGDSISRRNRLANRVVAMGIIDAIDHNASPDANP
jgi:hypothetical protein